jgi:hypothetical protein
MSGKRTARLFVNGSSEDRKICPVLDLKGTILHCIVVDI